METSRWGKHLCNRICSSVSDSGIKCELPTSTHKSVLEYAMSANKDPVMAFSV